MAETDPRTLDDLRAANRLAAARIQAARLGVVERREARRLRESLAHDWVTPYADLLDQFRRSGDPLVAGPTAYWHRRFGKDWPLFQTEQELAVLRAPSRVLCATSVDAAALVTGVRAYVIGPGYTYRPARRRKESELPPEVLAALQAVVDEFLDRNDWYGSGQPGVEEESFWRSLEDGEFLLCNYPQADGTTEVRIHEPEQLTQPPGSSYYDWLFGVCTDPQDVQKPLAYWVQHGDTPAEGEEYGPDRVTHFRRNTKRGQKRGRPDFCFGLFDLVDLSRRLRLNMADAAAQQTAIVFVRQHETATADDVQAFNDADADFTQTQALTGTPEPVKFARRGGREDIPKGMAYVDGPGNPHADKHLAILDAALRGAVASWNGFEWLISANAGNNNLPVDLSAESPFVRRVLGEQRRYRGAFRKTVWGAVRHHVETCGLVVAGRTYSWAEVEREVDLLVEAPSPQTRNKLEETQRASIEIPLGVDSRQRYMQDQGRDVDQVESDNRAWADEHGSAGDPLPLPDADGRIGGGQQDRQPAGGANELRGTVGGLDAISNMQQAFYDGKIPRQAAVAAMRILFGFEPAEAEKLFPDVQPVKRTDAGVGGLAALGESLLESVGYVPDAVYRVLLEHGAPPAPGLVFNERSHHWERPAKGGGGDLVPAGHVTAGLEEKLAAADPEGAKKPGLLKKAGDLALTCAAKAYIGLVKATPAIQKVLGLLPELLDTPDDLKKIGYNPSALGTAGHEVLDPLKNATGVSTHMAAAIASHVLGRGLVWVKSRLARSESEADAVAGAAEVLHGMLAAIAGELGLSEPPAATVIETHLRQLLTGAKRG